MLSACGDDTTSTSATSIAATSTTIAPTTSTIPLPTPEVPVKPTVQIPSALPTELGRTVLSEGAGPEAVDGDTVVVHYVGVLSTDGTEFDNSYDRGAPFPVEGIPFASVIEGWNQGLLGAQAGQQLQLDIPAEMAYGATGSGSIPPDTPITFVIDVLAVVGATDPADEPVVTLTPSSASVIEVTSEDLVTGDGAEAKLGYTVAVHALMYRADTGAKLESASTWPGGRPATFVLGDASTLAALNSEIQGMKVGGRRQITIPAADIYDGQGREELGLPAGVDVVFVIDLFAVY